MQSNHNSSDLPRSVLVVDDEPALATLLVKALQDVGLEVAVANDGWQALARVREHPPAAMLVDLELPGIDGLQFIESTWRSSPQQWQP
jgi:two-component system, OmpR family, response regulator